MAEKWAKHHPTATSRAFAALALRPPPSGISERMQTLWCSDFGKVLFFFLKDMTYMRYQMFFLIQNDSHDIYVQTICHSLSLWVTFQVGKDLRPTGHHLMHTLVLPLTTTIAQVGTACLIFFSDLDTFLSLSRKIDRWKDWKHMVRK